MLKVRLNYSFNGTDSHIEGGERMKSMTLTLTFEELRLLATLASDQLFRKQFIDPKMPGYRTNSDEVNLAKALVARLRLMLEADAPKKAPSATG